jgi:hypothetical protein
MWQNTRYSRRSDTKPDHARGGPLGTTFGQVNDGDGMVEPHREVRSEREVQDIVWILLVAAQGG